MGRARALANVLADGRSIVGRRDHYNDMADATANPLLQGFLPNSGTVVIWATFGPYLGRIPCDYDTKKSRLFAERNHPRKCEKGVMDRACATANGLADGRSIVGRRDQPQRHG